MISEADIEKAVDYLRDTAEPAGVARAQAEHLDEMRQVVLARIASRMNEGSETAKDRQARATVEYQEFLEGLRAAREADYTFRNHRASALAKIDAWRSQEASRRGVDRVG